jgi:hypothetical protein
VENLAQVYDRLAGEHTPAIWAERFADTRGKSEARGGRRGPVRRRSWLHGARQARCCGRLRRVAQPVLHLRDGDPSAP